MNRHDISVVNIYDPREREIPDVGLVRVRDAETGEELWVDTSNKGVREHYKRWSTVVFGHAKTLFNKFNVDSVSISTDQDYVKGLISLFKSR